MVVLCIIPSMMIIVLTDEERDVLRVHRENMADIKQDCIPGLCQVEVAGSVV